MKGEFLIEVVQKNTTLTTDQILQQLVKNFTACYTVDTNLICIDENPQIAVQFLNRNEIKDRTEGIIELCDYLIRAFTENQDIDRFQYFQRVLDYRKNKTNKHKTFLIIKYQTTLQAEFRKYFEFLNRFFPILDLLIFIEEVKDGFVFFFERENDFREYLYNITSVQSLRKMLENKNFQIPEDFFEKMVNIVHKKLAVSQKS